MKVFIAGTKTIKQLSNPVKKKISSIIMHGDEILVGDCQGADTAVQEYCHSCGFPNVTVYSSGASVRNNIGGWNVKNIEVPPSFFGFEFYRQKDIAMANDADCGLMIWDGKSRGTFSSISTLAKNNKTVLVYMQPTNSFYSIKGYSGVEKLLKAIV